MGSVPEGETWPPEGDRSCALVTSGGFSDAYRGHRPVASAVLRVPISGKKKIAFGKKMPQMGILEAQQSQDWIKRVGQIHGFEYTQISVSVRLS